MSTRKSKPASSSSTNSPPPPPNDRIPSTNAPPLRRPPPPWFRDETGRDPFRHQRLSRRHRQTSRPRGWAEKQRHRRDEGEGGRNGGEVTLLLTVYGGASVGWRSASLTFRPGRTTDEQLWRDIRECYRGQIEGAWRRWLLFKRVRSVFPTEFSRNDVPKRSEPSSIPGEKEFLHAYRHPEQIRTQREWVEWFRAFQTDPSATYGLEFVEGLWAAKLAALALAFVAVIVVMSVVWVVVWDGGLQTVFTVTGFVLSLVAALIALVALYYQIDLPG